MVRKPDIRNFLIIEVKLKSMGKLELRIFEK